MEILKVKVKVSERLVVLKPSLLGECENEAEFRRRSDAASNETRHRQGAHRLFIDARTDDVSNELNYFWRPELGPMLNLTLTSK